MFYTNYYQQLSVARYQVRFYANIYFDYNQTCTVPLKLHILVMQLIYHNIKIMCQILPVFFFLKDCNLIVFVFT